MYALLGKIVSLTGKEGQPGLYEVRFRPTCVLPRRASIPEWLKDQTLAVERSVPDVREIGHPGDSIVLTPGESSRWLSPLTVNPRIVYGSLPEAIDIRLRWWKDDKAPDYSVRANGCRIEGKFEKDGEEWSAKVETSRFFACAPFLPVDFEVTCDKMKQQVSVLPSDAPYARKLTLPAGEAHRMENGWYVVDVLPRTYGGAVYGLVEKSRGIDHFRRPEGLIQNPAENAGHVDRVSLGWRPWGGMEELSMTSVGSQREGGAIRLSLDGSADEGIGMRTSVVYTIYDEMPLLTLERKYAFQSPKKLDTPKPDEKPKEAIDDLRSAMLGFRSAWAIERDSATGSRLLCYDGERLAPLRAARIQESNGSWSWKMERGWAIVEHPRRRECTIYLFDPKSLPYMNTWVNANTITFEPNGYMRVVGQEGSIGYTLGISAGELCGASAEGGWVASRMAIPGGVRCAVIGRVIDGVPSTAEFTLGGTTISVPLRPVLTSGVGSMFSAMTDFPGGRLDQEYDVIAAGIAGRR